MANGGLLLGNGFDAVRYGSYSYNWFGTGRLDVPGAQYLGIGEGGVASLSDATRTHAPVHDYQVVAPSEMFMMTDSRPANYFMNGGGPTIPATAWVGLDYMRIWGIASSISGNPNDPASVEELPPPHSQAYNIAFGDGHVARVTRRNYLYPPIASPHWNRDNQIHSDTGEPVREWSVAQ